MKKKFFGRLSDSLISRGLASMVRGCDSYLIAKVQEEAGASLVARELNNVKGLNVPRQNLTLG